MNELKNFLKIGYQVKDMVVAYKRFQSYFEKACLIWTIHDYPRYTNVSHPQTQGHYACLPYGLTKIFSITTEHLGKDIYHRHRKFLFKGHPWHSKQYNSSFNGEDVLNEDPSKRWSRWDWIAQWGQIDERNLVVEHSGMTRCSTMN